MPETVAGSSASSAGSAWLEKIGASGGTLTGADGADTDGAVGAASLGTAADVGLAKAGDDALGRADGAVDVAGVVPPHATTAKMTAAAIAPRVSR